MNKMANKKVKVESAPATSSIIENEENVDNHPKGRNLRKRKLASTRPKQESYEEEDVEEVVTIKTSDNDEEYNVKDVQESDEDYEYDVSEEYNTKATKSLKSASRSTKSKTKSTKSSQPEDTSNFKDEQFQFQSII